MLINEYNNLLVHFEQFVEYWTYFADMNWNKIDQILAELLWNAKKKYRKLRVGAM